MRTMVLIGIVLVAAIWPLPVQAQSSLRSDKSWRGKNVHSGNKVRTSFYNYGMIGREIPEVGDYGCEWPINSGHVYVGDVSVLVGAEIKVRDKNDSVLTVHSVVVSDGPRSDNDGPAGNANIFWGWEPLPGFSSIDSLVAMSHQSETWPSTWPDKSGDPVDPGWQGKWNGYFGKNVQNADQESFWKMDDNYDEEFQTLYTFVPDRFNADRKGLALQMTARGMQWSNPLAEDCIFWLYEVTNYGTQYYDKTVFGMIMGGIAGNTYDGGSDSNDDLADFYRDLNLTSSYDGDNRGAKGFSPVAYSGYAFLESPGNPYDGIDNDGDGFGGGGGTQLTRDHQLFAPRSALTPGTPIVLINYETFERTLTTMGTSPVQVFYNGDTLTFYPDSLYKEIERNNLDDDLDGLIDETNGLGLSDTTGEPPLYIGYLAKNYLTGDTANLMIDERRDDGIDNDGDWNAETDDTGLDGSFETVDEGQRDGIPTSGRNTELPGEAHIDKTDVDESDQIGLTAFYYFDNGGSGKVRLKDDEGCWLAMRPGYFNIPNKNPIDGDFIYGTGYFPLNPGMTERLSLALLFGEDEQDLIRNKNTVQTIYDNNYNFAKAPDIPTVWSYAGDGFVTIYWDDVAERSNDIVTGYDFEGYKVYRTTDPSFLSNGIITDGYGTSKFSQPVMIYDKIDGWKASVTVFQLPAATPSCRAKPISIKPMSMNRTRSG
ncbi:MAG: hypothetical protein KBA26_07725 [Candidatus Delongbacteria bacterium]|nr:hypothetical protein [Candidatus Delongbacteria bacterium]